MFWIIASIIGLAIIGVSAWAIRGLREERERKQRYLADAIEELQSRLEDPNRLQNEEGDTLLHCAVRDNHIIIPLRPECIGQLGDPNAKNSNGNTPLHLAAQGGNDYAAKHLLDPEPGRNLNSRNLHENTPLHLAARNGHIEVIRILLNAGAKPDVRNKDGATPLDLAREGQHYDVIDLL